MTEEILTIRIHDLETGEIIDRPLTAEEIAQKEKDLAEQEAIKLAKEKAQIAKKALLDKLGISEEEARLLLG